MSDLKVFITRHPQDYIGGEISISKIRDVKWDSISGGVKRKQNGYSLYGHIDYNIAKNIVNCSGFHDYGYNDAKICIPYSKNNCPEYQKGYKQLESQAEDKPPSPISITRPTGFPPCTKHILEILASNSPQTRGDLRNTVTTDGYPLKTFRSALNSLKKQGKIILEGNSCSSKQIISLTKNK